MRNGLSVSVVPAAGIFPSEKEYLLDYSSDKRLCSKADLLIYFSNAEAV